MSDRGTRAQGHHSRVAEIEVRLKQCQAALDNIEKQWARASKELSLLLATLELCRESEADRNPEAT